MAELDCHAVLLNAEGGGYVAICPEVHIGSQGGSVKEAVANLREAAELYLEARPDECPQGETVGEASIKPLTVSVDENACGMDCKLPALSGGEIGRVLEKLGYVFDRKSGNHMIYHHDYEDAYGSHHHTAIVPDAKKVYPGALYWVLTGGGCTKNEFLEKAKPGYVAPLPFPPTEPQPADAEDHGPYSEPSGKMKEIQVNAVLLNAVEGGWYVPINAETGAVSQGKTVEEALAMVRECTECTIEYSPEQCPRGETVGVGIIKPMKVSVEIGPEN
ncbi:MAG: hypothetical protein MPJ81_00700 [Gammaproteobacteria bacterium]|nr:hypothetical protein [Gammaproteobacteria bacterium]